MGRGEMVDQIRRMGVKDERVLAAMTEVDRAEFVPDEWKGMAYEDRPLPIGYDQTISQPYTVARMVELVMPPGEKVLEIGTGSGYQAAILARLFERVYSVEVVSQLSKAAKKSLDVLGIKNCELKVGDGKEGWREHAPYGAIIVAADAREVPKALVDQLEEGGRIVIPVKDRLMKGVKESGKVRWEGLEYYVFVPLV